MAEFAEIVRQARRMCGGFKRAEDCKRCRLGDARCERIPSDWDDESIATFERIIMNWASEHPEPKYPTWVKWLTEQGIIACGNPIVWRSEALQPIPADIAERLGVEPKGGE